MKLKHILFASLLLAILMIGAVSASEDIASDDSLAVDEGVEIEEAPADDVIATDDSADDLTIEDDEEDLALDEGEDTLALDEDDFEIYNQASYVTHIFQNVLNIEIVNESIEGTFYVYVEGNQALESSSDSLFCDCDDLGIYNKGTYGILVNFTSDEMETITLAHYDLTVDIEDVPPVYIHSYLDISEPNNPLAEINDLNHISGTIVVTINGKTCYNKKITGDSTWLMIRTSDLDLSGFGYATYPVVVTYTADNGTVFTENKNVALTVIPDVDGPHEFSVGENAGLIISGPQGISGSATLYSAVSDGEGGYKKGNVITSAAITNGYGRISLSSLPEGYNYVYLDFTFGNYVQVTENIEYDVIRVFRNSPGYGSSVSASTITVGDSVTVTITGPASSNYVWVYLDNKDNADGTLATGSFSKVISGLKAGTHYICVQAYDDEDMCVYSNTFVITVKEKTAPAPAKKTTKKTTISLVLKKVKIKKSAKKLVLSATLKINKKAVKGKIIKFKFKGKTYRGKTNKKGVAKVTIKKKVLKKLKVGKKITYRATYSTKTVKRTVKVKK